MKTTPIRLGAWATPLTVAAALAFTTQAFAQGNKSAHSASGPAPRQSLNSRGASGPVSSPTGPAIEFNTKWFDLFKKLGFPYGTQSFEYVDVGSSVVEASGWEQLGSPGSLLATVVAGSAQNQPRPGTQSRRWLCIQDFGATGTDAMCTPAVSAPAPWDYTWSFSVNLEHAPIGSADWPMLAVQHPGSAGFQDAWGIEFKDTGAELYLSSSFGTATAMPLFSYDEVGLGQWIDLRISASLDKSRLEAFVNGVSAGYLGINPKASTILKRVRLAYHGQGTGTTNTLFLDDLVLAFNSAVCKENLDIDFTTDDNGAALVNGQDISSPAEFGNKVSMMSSGPNAGAAIFDSSLAGPNNPSQDLDLLVDQGNILILQTSANTTQTVAGIFDRPNDEDSGGTHTWSFTRPVQPLSIDLIDIDSFASEGVQLTLTDSNGNERVYSVPADWTGDLTLAQPGVGTLDLTTLANQAGFNSTATATEDVGYDGNAVIGLVIETTGSMGLDNFHACIPCVEIDFETEDDGVTVLADGQDLSTPPEFGIELSISSFGPNAGAALFDSTPGGPNDPGPDRDLVVGCGNILILQNSTATTQTVPGFFDVPNDDQDGGTIVFDFPGPIEAHRIDVIDFDEEDVDGIEIVLMDQIGNTRTYTVPGGFTEDLLNDGPPAFRTLDLSTLASQPGFLASATAVEDVGFDPADVIMITLNFGGPGAVDNLCFCPQ